MSFSPDQKAALEAPLSPKHVAERDQAGRKLSYIEGWHAIAEANRIFGHDSWTRETTELRCIQERERTIGKDNYQKPGWGVSYIARVRIVVFAGDTLVTREGIGAGHGIDADLGAAHESAVKEAETDAMKRALSTFGWPFGLALYDKSKSHVGEAPEGNGQTNGRANGHSHITEEQAENIRNMAEEVGADLAKFCRFLKVDSIPVLPAARYQEAIDALNLKRTGR